jgi:hypothetical protein
MIISHEAAAARTMTRAIRSLPGLRDVAISERAVLAGMTQRGWKACAEKYIELAKVSQRIGWTKQAKRFARAVGACERRAASFQRAMERAS